MRAVDSSLLGNGLWNREKQCESFTGSHELILGLGIPRLWGVPSFRIFDENADTNNATRAVLRPNHTHLVYCSDLTLSVIVFSFKPCHHNTSDADKVTIHIFALVVPFGFRQEQGSIVTKVEFRGIRASVPCREVVVVVGRAYTHLSDTDPLCLPSQPLMDYVSA